MSRSTCNKIQKVWWEQFLYAANSLDIAPKNYHLNRSMQQLSEKCFMNQNDAKRAFTYLATYFPQERNPKVSCKRWEEVLSNEGVYILYRFYFLI